MMQTLILRTRHVQSLQHHHQLSRDSRPLPRDQPLRRQPAADDWRYPAPVVRNTKTGSDLEERTRQSGACIDDETRHPMTCEVRLPGHCRVLTLFSH
jgi:hypothetical protein